MIADGATKTMHSTLIFWQNFPGFCILAGPLIGNMIAMAISSVFWLEFKQHSDVVTRDYLPGWNNIETLNTAVIEELHVLATVGNKLYFKNGFLAKWKVLWGKNNLLCCL